MSTPHLIQTIFTIVIATLIIWGLFNEQKLINFEDKLIEKWKERKTK